jgi:hypothetical protein
MSTKVVGLVQSGHNHHFVTGSGHEIIEKKYLTLSNNRSMYCFLVYI